MLSVRTDKHMLAESAGKVAETVEMMFTNKEDKEREERVVEVNDSIAVSEPWHGRHCLFVHLGRY